MSTTCTSSSNDKPYSSTSVLLPAFNPLVHTCCLNFVMNAPRSGIALATPCCVCSPHAMLFHGLPLLVEVRMLLQTFHHQNMGATFNDSITHPPRPSICEGRANRSSRSLLHRRRKRSSQGIRVLHHHPRQLFRQAKGNPQARTGESSCSSHLFEVDILRSSMPKILRIVSTSCSQHTF